MVGNVSIPDRSASSRRKGCFLFKRPRSRLVKRINNTTGENCTATGNTWSSGQKNVLNGTASSEAGYMLFVGEFLAAMDIILASLLRLLRVALMK
jgi:hypothetical protein